MWRLTLHIGSCFGGVLVLVKATPLVRQGGNPFGGVQGGVGRFGRVGHQGNNRAGPTMLARLIVSKMVPS